MNSHMEKIVSLTTRNNIKLAPLAFEYVKNFALGIGMPEEKSKEIALLTREVLERRMLNGYKGVGEITIDILVGLDRIRIEIADRGIPYWVDIQRERRNRTVRPDEFSIKKLGTEGQRLCMSFYLESGKQWSYLSVNDHGQVLGHVSLAFHDEFPGMPEIGSLVSKQFCRGHNVAGRMVEQLCTDAEKAGITGAYAVPVGFHPFSQKIFNRQGFVPVGMILHYLPAKNAWDYAEGNRRMDMFVCAKMFHNPGQKTIYIPEKHRDFICGIYSRLNIECDCRTSASGRQSLPQSQYMISQDRDLLMAEFLIRHIGDDFEEDLAHIMQDFKDNGMELVKVYLNISDPSAIRAYDILENNGYYFSGILPGCENGEYLMMGHLMGLPMKWDRITPDGENQMILDYIQKNICENN